MKIKRREVALISGMGWFKKKEEPKKELVWSRDTFISEEHFAFIKWMQGFKCFWCKGQLDGEDLGMAFRKDSNKESWYPDNLKWLCGNCCRSEEAINGG